MTCVVARLFSRAIVALAELNAAAILFDDLLRLKDSLVGVGLLLLSEGLLERNGVQTWPKPNLKGRRGHEHRLAAADLPERQRARDRVRVVAPDEDPNGKPGALLDLRRRFDALNEHFVLVSVAGGKGDNIDLNVVPLGDPRLRLGAAEILIAVADQYDALAGSLRKRCKGQLQGGRDIGVVAVYRASDFGEIQTRGVAGRKLQLGASTENDYSCLVAFRSWPASSTDSLMKRLDPLPAPIDALGRRCRVRLPVLRHAQRAVHDKHDRDVFVRAADSRFGQGQGQQDHETTAQPDREPAPNRSQSGEAAIAERDDYRHQAQRQKPPRLIYLDVDCCSACGLQCRARGASQSPPRPAMRMAADTAAAIADQRPMARSTTIMPARRTHREDDEPPSQARTGQSNRQEPGAPCRLPTEVAE